MVEKIKFKVWPLEQRLEKEPDVEVWEGEGGTVEAQEETVAEVPETVVEELRVERSWREILIQAKDEFPEDIQRVIDKDSQGGKLNQQEYHRLDHFAQLWFRDIFGMRIKKKMGVQELPKKKVKKTANRERAIDTETRSRRKIRKKKSEKAGRTRTID